MFKDLRPLAGVFLHYILHHFRRDRQVESSRQQFRHGAIRSGDDAQPADFAAGSLTGSTTSMLRTVATSLISWRAQSPRPLPRIHISRVRHKRQGQKADQDVRFDPLGLLMKDRAQAQIAFADAEGSLRPGSAGCTIARVARDRSPCSWCASR